jgi:hypothetical protein
MHGQIGGPYYKGPGGGSKTNDPGVDNTVNNSGGTPGHSVPQRPVAAPENPGPPESMKKALAKKNNSGSGPGAPNKGTSYAGSI